ncbi:hypothetical protein K3169_24930 [Pseudomonas phytophila]|uniref:Uncharacterized protein n=1 Tax=Pseudomonas phytophila TaxID=2867264 RepID=A0ABY6FCC0_9PSED|nr:hypothetical protein [Pseudomonas phytophila]UXZ95533.1 hypothetical protein K3169_24930 [Pseudomonas phytophila]
MFLTLRCLVANIRTVGAAEGCDRGVSGEMLRSLRQLLQKCISGQVIAFGLTGAVPVFLTLRCLVANIRTVGAAEGCDRGVSGEMLRSLRQLLQEMYFNQVVCILSDESRID